MNENYSEYAVPVRQTGGMWLKWIGAVAVTVAALFLTMAAHWLFIVLVAAGAVGCYLSYLTSQMEYETIFLDGTLEIAAIYQKQRRKKKFECEMKQVLGYHLGKKEDAVRLGKITKDFSSRRKDVPCCVMKVGTEKETQVICFEPGEELVEILERRYRQLKA